MPDPTPDTEPSGDAKAPQRGMGRGLAAILPRSRADEPGLRELALDLIVPNPRQPRRDFDEDALLALAESIRSRGLLQPIVVRPLAGGTFELVAGERRLRAAKLAGLERIPAVVRQADDWERLDLALAENMARVDLNPIEEARACAMLVEDLGLTKGEVGRRVGKSRVAVSNLIRLLELPDEVLELIEAGALSEGHGRAILLAKDHDERKRLALRRPRRRLVGPRDRAAGQGAARRTPRRERTGPIELHPDLADALAAAEDALQAALGVEVQGAARTAPAAASRSTSTRPPRASHLAERLLRREPPAEARAA